MGRQPKLVIVFAFAAAVAVAVGAIGAAVVRQPGAAPTPSPAAAIGSPTTSTVAPIVSPTPTPTPTSPPPILTGAWSRPADGAKATTSSLKLAATPTGVPADVTIAKVRFTIGWKGVAAKTACTATKPAAGGEWTCTADLANLGAPKGTLTLDFEVVIDAGDVTHSPDGTRTVAYAGPPDAATWSKPQQVERAQCSSIAAAIDGDGTYHVAAGCDGRIDYTDLGTDDWDPVRFQPPADRQEYDPQLAVQGDVLYLAYTRVSLGEGGCGDNGLTDVGVYYRTRTLSTGRDWSDPKRIGEIGDRLQAFRFVGGVIHATVVNADERHLYYETVKGALYNRYEIPLATGMTSLRIGDDGRARIAYEAGTSLRYATFTGAGFSTRAIPGTDRGYGPVLVLGANDQPHLMWFRGFKPGGGCAEPDPLPKDGTYYSAEQGGAWHSERLVARRQVASVTVDTSSGRVHVLVSGERGRLVYLTKVGTGSWSKRVVDPSNVLPAVIRLDQDSGDLLVVYLKWTDNESRPFMVAKR